MDEPPVTQSPDSPAPDVSKSDTASSVPARRKSFVRELPILVLLAFALAVLVKTFLVQAFYIPSESMVPTLEVGDRVLVNKVVYRIRNPERGEIIVFIAHHGERTSFLRRVRSVLFEGLGVTKPADTDFIKRIIALPGETIELRQGAVYITPVHGKQFRLTEPYLDEVADTSSYGPFVVPRGEFFVMGDNRTNSADSRTALGSIARREIVGKAFVRMWPPGRLEFFHRPRYVAGRSVRSRAA